MRSFVSCRLQERKLDHMRVCIALFYAGCGKKQESKNSKSRREKRRTLSVALLLEDKTWKIMKGKERRRRREGKRKTDISDLLQYDDSTQIL
jgi:hypothetical protein